jgi:hypothetical protein
MSVGTGIFLGLAILATVLLYTQTKDRWRWRSIAKWTALTIATPLVIGSLWFGYTNLENYRESRPKRITTYADISLGDTKAEVRYAKGVPTDVLVDDPPGKFPFPGVRTNISLSDIPSGKQITDYKYWDYDSAESGRIDVDFSPESQRVTRVFCYASTLVVRAAPSCPVLLGISDGVTEEEVLRRLGAPSKSEISEGFGTTKTLYYSQWNVAFYLEKRRVYGLQIESADALAAR